MAHETGDPTAMSDLLSTDAWQALVGIAKSLQAERESSNPFCLSLLFRGYPKRVQFTLSNSLHDCFTTATRQQQQPLMSNDGFEEIPQHLLDEINASGASVVGSSTTGGGGGVGESTSEPAGPRACPHCTFENPPGNTDCELCGLPLSG